jgi:biopolymer transport protein ExbD
MAKIDAVARMKISRKSKPKELSPDEEGGELNIIPYLDIVVNIIMFLLATTVVAVSLTNINVSSPSIGAGGAGGGEEQSLNLTVTVTDQGFTVAASGGVLTAGCQRTGPPPTVAKLPTGYDFEGLTRCVSEVKRTFPDETRVIVAANPEVPYETIVQSLDALRGDSTKILFPDVMLSAGIQ